MKQPKNLTLWAPWEDEAIRELVFTCSMKEVAIYVCRGRDKVRIRVSELGLDWVIPYKTLASRMQKGAPAHNKGKKVSAAHYAKMKRRMFKKGLEPHNTLNDGHITMRSDKSGRVYQCIRISKGKWQQLHRYMWEQEHGPISEGHVVIFKDGNTMNCVMDNLQAITRREHRIRNGGLDVITDKRAANFLATTSKKVDYELRDELLKYPALLELKRQQLFLKRQIKQQHHVKQNSNKQ